MKLQAPSLDACLENGGGVSMFWRGFLALWCHWSDTQAQPAGEVISTRLFLFFFFFFPFFTASPAVYGSSQVRGRRRAAAEAHAISTAACSLHTHVAAWGNAGSPSHWPRPGIDLHPQGDYVGSLTHWAMMGTPSSSLNWLRLELDTVDSKFLKTPWANI